MTKRKTWTKAIAVLLFCTVLTVGVVSAPPFKAEATTLADLENKLNDLKNQEKQIANELNQAKKDVKNQEAYQNQLSYQINNVESQISTLNQRISTLNDQISQKETEIEQAQKNIDENFDLFKKRLRVMYMSNDATVLSVLFGSSTFAEFLSAAETIQRIADHDDRLIEELSAQKRQIEEDKAAIEESRKKVEADRQSLISKQSQLDQARAESNEELEQLKLLEAKAKKSYAEIVQDLEAADAEIKEYIRTHQSTGQLSPGGWLWPVAGRTRISSGYGYRILNGVREFHKGIDIPCPYNTPIRAAKSGTVIRANFSSSYGNIVIIDHGGGYSTVYAHNTSLQVSYGQQVQQGQTVALAGQTGQAYGVHCHFEVRVNGVVENPLNYVMATG